MINRFYERLAVAMSLLILATVVLGLVELVLDKVFGTPTSWIYDVVIMLNAVCFICGGAYALQQDRHITISILRARMTGIFATFVDRLNLAIVGFFCVVFTWFAGIQALSAIVGGETSGHAWDGPMPQIIRATILIGGVLLVLRVVMHFIQRRPLFVHDETHAVAD